MQRDRIGRLAVAAGVIGAGAALAGSALPSHACPESDRVSVAGRPADAGRFAVRGWEGLACQLTNINASVACSVQNWGQPGGRLTRSMSINGAVFDQSGARLYRMSEMPRLVEFTDFDGHDLAATAQVNAYPQPPYGMHFVQPSGSQTNISFGVNLNAGERSPRGIRRLAIEIPVELAADIVRVSLPRERQEESAELAPNLKGRVVSFSEGAGGELNLVFEYRVELGEGPRPAFYQLEVLDTSGELVHANTQPQEIITRDALVGTVRVQGVGLGRRELGDIRVTLITDLVPHTFEIVEENVPLFE